MKNANKSFIKSFFISFTCFFVIPFLVAIGVIYFSYRQFTNELTKTNTTANLSSETKELINELNAEYGFNIYIGIDPNDYENSILRRFSIAGGKYYIDNSSMDDEEIYNFLSEFKRVCNSYTKEQLKEIPKEIFLANQIYQIDENNMMTNFAAGLTISIGVKWFDTTIKKPTYLMFKTGESGLTPEHTIEHEFFHCFSSYFDKETNEKIKNLNLNCNDISEYACTNYSEMNAEAYAKKMIDRELIKK